MTDAADRSMPPPTPPQNPPLGATEFLRRILRDLEAERLGAVAQRPADAAPVGETGNQSDDAAPVAPAATLGDVLSRLDERAFGLLLLLLALPCCLPFVYLLPQIVSLPMLALAAQLAAGRTHPWLPEKLKSREFSIPDFRKVIERSEKYVGWIENIARPRFRAITGRVGARVTGALLLVPTASIMVPLPSTNTVPGIGVAIAALGLIERDGFLVILGLVIGFIWVGLLGFFGLEAASLIKDWVSARV